MFGTVDIARYNNEIVKGCIVRVNEPWIDGEYLKILGLTQKSELGTLMWNSIDILIKEEINDIKKIRITELRNVDCDGADEGYSLEGSYELQVQESKMLESGMMWLRCL